MKQINNDPSNDTKTQANKYGSITVVQEQDTDNVDYEIGETHYLTSEANSSVTEYMHRKRVGTIALISLFVLIMGALSYALFHDFNSTLYPEHGGGVSSSSTKGKSYVYDDTDVESTTSTASKGEKDMNSSVDVPTKTESSTSSTTTNGSQNDSNKNTKSVTSSSSSCESHPKCLSLGLTGICCPTTSGLQLDCCN